MVATGLALVAGVTGVSGLLWGGPGALAAGIAGLAGFGLQITASRLLRGQVDAPIGKYMKRWALGTGLRFLGVVLVAVLVLVDRSLFPPLPTALGFLGVLIPLLGLELRQG